MKEFACKFRTKLDAIQEESEILAEILNLLNQQHISKYKLKTNDTL